MTTNPTPEPNGDRPGEGWSIGLRLCIERSGRLFLGKGRHELLELIDRHHSISAAARVMGMSYRRAWELVQAVNQAAGEPLVITETGGSGGGGAHLTPEGVWAMSVYRELHGRLDATAAVVLAQILAHPPSPALHVAAAVSLEDVLGRLLTDYRQSHPATRVRSVFGASDELADHVLAGSPVDLFISADPAPLDRLEAARLLRSDSRTPLADNGLALIGAPDGRRDSLRLDEVRRGVGRLAIAESGCPLGRYSRAWLESVRATALIGSAVSVDNSRAVLSAIRSGQAETGLVYSSDALDAGACRVLLRPTRLPLPIRYHAAVTARGGDAALDLLSFLISDAAAHRFTTAGFLRPRS